jgi:hypothetical protein
MKCISAAFIGIGLFFISTQAFAQSALTQYYTFEKDFAPYLTLGTSISTRVTEDIWVEDDVFHIQPVNFHFRFLDHTLDSVSINQDNLFFPERNYFITPFGNFLMFDRANYDTLATIGVSPIYYTIDSSAGNRILKIEWQNAGFFYDSSSYLNFQIWLYEGSNTIEIRYGKSRVNMKLSQLIGCGPLVGIGKVDTVAGKDIYDLDLYGDAKNPGTIARGVSGKRCLDSVPPEGMIYRFLFHDSAKVIEHYPANYSVYPNPTRGLVHIDLTSASPASFNLYNSFGTKVISTMMTYGQKFDLSHLSSGLYIARISQDKNLYTQKILLTR